MTIKYVEGSKEEFKQAGVPTFNNAPHMLIDLSEVKSPEMQTIVLKLADDEFVTICHIPYAEKGSSLDIKYHGELYNKMLGFKEGTSQSIEANLFALHMMGEKR